MVELLLNQVMAFDYFQQLLRKRFGVFFQIISHNRSRHRVYKYSAGVKGRCVPSFYAVFHRDFFHNFNNEFPEFVANNGDLRGLGESLNLDWLKVAIRLRVDWIVFIHSDESVYVISPLLFYKFAEKYKLMRGQQKINYYKSVYSDGKFTGQSEVTMSVPVKLLTNFWDVDF